MKKRTIIFLALVGLILIIWGLFKIYKFDLTNHSENNKNTFQLSLHDATYIINGEKVTLKNGVSETEITSNSASKKITRYFGNEVKHDFDGDGHEDSVFLLTQETGGSGIFYYVVALLNTVNGPIGSQGLLLGDRIAPQTTGMDKGNIIIVNYADRNPGESFAISPSAGKSLWLLLNTKTMQFGEVVQNFEGEADPSRMTLNMKTWNWINTIYNNDTEIKPKIDNKFTLTFKNDGIFSATTDCNGVGGKYSINGNRIMFNKMMSTLMYCEGSQESDFTKMLNETQSYLFTSKGELILNLSFDSGSMIFR